MRGYLSIFTSLILFTSLIGAPSANAWSSAQTTISVFGGTSADFSSSIAVDNSGNIYTTGYFQGTVDFDPGVGTTNLISTGDYDVFVSKLDSTGALLWAKSFGGTSADFSDSIAVDNSGNVYTTGYFQGTVDFDPGVGTTNLISTGDYDVFVSKLDSTGALLWAKSFGGTSNDRARSIAVDNSGNVHTTGFFQGTADFDPGVGTTNLTSAGGNNFINDIFVSKLDSTGALLWAKSFAGATISDSRSIAVDNSGNVYTTGYFRLTVDFDPGEGVTELTGGGFDNYDVFVSKLDSTGALLWAKSFAGTSAEGGYSIALDNSGNIYTTGDFQGTVDFDPGVGTTNLTSAGGNDVFVSKLDSTGSLLWAKSFGGTSSDTGYSIAVDTSGNIYTTGDFQGTVDFDPGVGTTNLTSAGDYDVFVLKLFPSGEVRDVAAANAEAARVAAAAAEAAKKAKEQKELMEILALIPSIGELTLSLGETTKSLYSTKCVKGKTTKYVKYGAKCPKGYKKK
jgi:alpha-tubulin suppressor-like RCC1 family protein